jgi:indolepyruvate ferredoxin oxidoreductase
VSFNQAAFNLGRLMAADPARVNAAVAGNRPEPDFKPLMALADIVGHRVALLTEYQDASYANRYRELVELVAATEERSFPGSTALAVTVAQNFYKLMAYKDEYEVARLHSDPAFHAKLKAAFEDGATLRYNLAPPLFSKRDPETGHLNKREFGPWVSRVFTVLARLRGLRGTPFDIFGYTAERRMERHLIDHYEAQMREVAERLSPTNHKVAIELAELPAQIRGYGHVKEANVEKVRTLESLLVERFRSAGLPLAPEREPITKVR